MINERTLACHHAITAPTPLTAHLSGWVALPSCYSLWIDPFSLAGTAIPIITAISPHMLVFHPSRDFPAHPPPTHIDTTQPKPANADYSTDVVRDTGLHRCLRITRTPSHLPEVALHPDPVTPLPCGLSLAASCLARGRTPGRLKRLRTEAFSNRNWCTRARIEILCAFYVLPPPSAAPPG